MEIATHRHGCCVLQRCIDFATPSQKKALVEVISAHALVLSQDAFGNYVVQVRLGAGEAAAGAWGLGTLLLAAAASCCWRPLHTHAPLRPPPAPHHRHLPRPRPPAQYVLDMGHAEASTAVITKLAGHFAELSMQKFSSNVVEKCLKLAGVDQQREAIIKEMVTSPLLPRWAAGLEPVTGQGLPEMLGRGNLLGWECLGWAGLAVPACLPAPAASRRLPAHA